MVHSKSRQLLGIGERAGNASIEEIIAILTKKQIVMTSLNLPDIYKTSMNISKILDIRLAENKPVIGKIYLNMNQAFIKMALIKI